MPKKICGAGRKWDSLLNECMPLDTGPGHPTFNGEPSIAALVSPKNTPPADQTVAAFNPALWIFVLLATLGSILAMVLWLVIYIRHTQRYTGEEPAEQPPLKTDPPATAHCLPPSVAHNTLQECQHTVLPTAVWHEGGGSERTENEVRDWSGLKGSAVRQETVPLPATELVTTKTL